MQAPRSLFSGLPEYFKPLKLGWILSLLSSSNHSDFENSGAQKSSPRKSTIIIHSSIIPWTLRIHRYVFDITSGQTIIFHQAGFSWHKGISLHQLYALIDLDSIFLSYLHLQLLGSVKSLRMTLGFIPVSCQSQRPGTEQKKGDHGRSTVMTFAKKNNETCTFHAKWPWYASIFVKHDKLLNLDIQQIDTISCFTTLQWHTNVQPFHLFGLRLNHWIG